jgi:hypothetical protein
MRKKEILAIMVLTTIIGFIAISVHMRPSWAQFKPFLEGWVSDNTDLRNATKSGERVVFRAYNSLLKRNDKELRYSPERSLWDEEFNISFPGALSANISREVLHWKEVCTEVEGDIEKCTPGVDCDAFACSYTLVWTEENINSNDFQSPEYQNPVVLKSEADKKVHNVERVVLTWLGKVLARLDLSPNILKSTSWRPVKFTRGSTKDNFNIRSYANIATGAFHVPIDTLSMSSPICIDNFGKHIVLPFSSKELVLSGQSSFNVCNHKSTAGTVRVSYEVQAPVVLLGTGVVRDARGMWEWLISSPAVWNIENVPSLTESNAWEKFVASVPSFRGSSISYFGIMVTVLCGFVLLRKYRHGTIEAEQQPSGQAGGGDESEQGGAGGLDDSLDDRVDSQLLPKASDSREETQLAPPSLPFEASASQLMHPPASSSSSSSFSSAYSLCSTDIPSTSAESASNVSPASSSKRRNSSSSQGTPSDSQAKKTRKGSWRKETPKVVKKDESDSDSDVEVLGDA